MQSRLRSGWYVLLAVWIGQVSLPGQPALLDSASYYLRRNLDKAGEFTQQALTFSQKVGDDSLKLQALILQGEIHLRSSNYGPSQKVLDEALVLAKARSDSLAQSIIYSHFGGIAYFQGQFDQAADWVLRAVSISPDEPFRARMLNNLGSIFEKIGDSDRALYYYRQALALHEKNGHLGMAASTLGNIGVVFHNEEAYLEAISHFRESLRYAENFRDTLALSIRWQNLGNAFTELGMYDSAAVYLDRALRASELMTDTVGMASIRNSRARLSLNLQNYEAAIKDLETGYDLAQRIQDTTDMTMAVLWLSEAYAKNADFQNAYRSFRRYHHLDSLLHSQEKNRLLYELEARYQNVAKEKQLQEQAFILKQQKRERDTLILVSVLIAVIALVSSWALYSRWQQQKQMARQEQEINAQKMQRLREEQKLLAVQSMVAGEEAERTRLARELHDSLGGMLSTIKLALGKSSAIPGVAQATDLVDRASQELRRIAQNMIPEALDRFGLTAALEDLVSEWTVHTDQHIDFQHFGVDETNLPTNLALTIYRVIQELIHNAIKHAQAGEILVQLMQHDDHVHITVEDDGVGFDPQTSDVRTGMGLKNLQSRLGYWEGKLDIESKPGEGTTLTVHIPLSEKSSL